MKNLRARLRPHFPGESPIRSVYGVGYGLESALLDAGEPGPEET